MQRPGPIHARGGSLGCGGVILAVLCFGCLGSLFKSKPETPPTYVEPIVEPRAIVTPADQPDATAAEPRGPSLSGGPHAGKVWVQPYTRRDGTRVQGHWRQQ